MHESSPRSAHGCSAHVSDTGQPAEDAASECPELGHKSSDETRGLQGRAPVLRGSEDAGTLAVITRSLWGGRDQRAPGTRERKSASQGRLQALSRGGSHPPAEAGGVWKPKTQGTGFSPKASRGNTALLASIGPLTSRSINQ